MSAPPVGRPEARVAAAPPPQPAAEAPPRKETVDQIFAEFAPLPKQEPLTLNLFPPRARPRDLPKDPRFAASTGTPTIAPVRPPRSDSQEVWEAFRGPPGHRETISRAHSFPLERPLGASGRPVCFTTEETPHLTTLNTFPRYNPEGSENRRGYFWSGVFDPSLASPLHSSTVQGRTPSSFTTKKSSEDASSGVAYSDLPSILSLDSAPSLCFPGVDFPPGLLSGSSCEVTGRDPHRIDLEVGPKRSAAAATALADIDQLAFGKWPQYRQSGQLRPSFPGGGDEGVLSEGGYTNSSAASRDSVLRCPPPLWPGDAKAERQLLEMRQLEAERARAERNMEAAGCHVALTSPFFGGQGRPDWRADWEAAMAAGQGAEPRPETRADRNVELPRGEKRPAADAAEGADARQVKRVFWAGGGTLPQREGLLPHREGLGESPEILTRAESLAESFAPASRARNTGMLDLHGFSAANARLGGQLPVGPPQYRQQVFGLKREELLPEPSRAAASKELRALDLFPTDAEPLLTRTRAEPQGRFEPPEHGPFQPTSETERHLTSAYPSAEPYPIHRPPLGVPSFPPPEAGAIRVSPTGATASARPPTAPPGQSADATWWIAGAPDAPLTVVGKEQAAALEGRVLVDYQTGIPVLLRSGSLDSQLAAGAEVTGAFGGGGRWQHALPRVDEECSLGIRHLPRPESEGGYLLSELAQKPHVSSWGKQELAEGGARLAAYTCRFCGQSFDKSTALGGHMRCHRGERQQEKLSTPAADEKPSAAVRLSPSFPQWGPFTLSTPR